MIIKKSRINSVDKYFANIAEDKEVYVSVPADENNIDLLKMDGCLDGTCVVPQPIGPVTRFNLYGKELIHKEMEKEHREIERDYHIVDWHGTDHYGTCFQNRMCYPKEYIFPPLSRIIRDSGKLRSELLTKADVELLKHTINMFLEVFGYCEIVDKDENPIGQKIKIKEVSWRILPPGKYPWERAEKALDDYFEKAPGKNKEVLRNNHKTFAKYEPDFLAMSEDGVFINIDGNANRVAAYAYGPKHVLLIVGMNKVVKTEADAMSRARNEAAPINAQRFGIDTPCSKNGTCFDCKSPQCICCQILTTRFSRVKGRFQIILVDENLGF